MTTTKSINTSSYISCCAAVPPKPLSRVERTKSFLKASLIKKWKSSKELFTKPLSSFTNSDHHKSASRKHLESQLQNGKFINEKVLDNLDEFERNFLLSAGRKILVRELRKNFEKPQNNQQQQQQTQTQTEQSCGNSNKSGNGVVITVNAGTGGVGREHKARTKESNLRANSMVAERPKKYANASVQTSPDYENISYETKTTENGYGGQQKKCPLVSRHSFYNTYRNEYVSWQSPSQYASNLSLISCGIPSNRERCLEKTINKYNNSIRSSSAVDLSSISAVVLNSAMPTTMNRQYSSIINISHTNSSQNLTETPIIDYDYGSLDVSTSYAIYENTKSVQNSKNNANNINNNNNYSSNQNNNRRNSCSIGDGDNCPVKRTEHLMEKNQNTVSSLTLCDGINNANVNIHFRNGDYDTKSMIVSTATAAAAAAAATADSRLCDPSQNACHFNRCASQTDFYGSNISLTIVNGNDSNHIYSNINNLSSNCHSKNLNNKMNNLYQDGNNNDTTTAAASSTTTKIRKCHSINQIDLGLLKNELDEYIDRDLRTTNFGRNTLAQRRCQFESNLKKVIKMDFKSLFDQKQNK